MFNKATITMTALAVTSTLVLTACSSTKLSTVESCALIDELAVEHSIKEKWEMAYIAILAENTEPVVDALEAASIVYREVSEQTGDRGLRTALNTSVENYQKFIEIIKARSPNEPTFDAEVEELTDEMDDGHVEYIRRACPGSIVDPD